MYWNMCCAVDWMLQNRLTLTWDVLKSVAPRQNAPTGAGLTLTWDVLKFVIGLVNMLSIVININMGCIEIVESPPCMYLP